MLQVIGTFVSDGEVLSLGLGAGFDKLPIEDQRKIMAFCGQFIEKIVAEMDADIEALKEGAKADAEDLSPEYKPEDNAAVEGDEA